jgi:hypothetical protein
MARILFRRLFVFNPLKNVSTAVILPEDVSAVLASMYACVSGSNALGAGTSIVTVLPTTLTASGVTGLTPSVNSSSKFPHLGIGNSKGVPLMVACFNAHFKKEKAFTNLL